MAALTKEERDAEVARLLGEDIIEPDLVDPNLVDPESIPVAIRRPGVSVTGQLTSAQRDDTVALNDLEPFDIMTGSSGVRTVLTDKGNVSQVLDYLYAKEQQGDKIYPSDLGHSFGFFEAIFRTLDKLKPGGAPAAHIANPNYPNAPPGFNLSAGIVGGAIDVTLSMASELAAVFKAASAAATLANSNNQGGPVSPLSNYLARKREEMGLTIPPEVQGTRLTENYVRFQTTFADAFPDALRQASEDLHYTPVTETGKQLIGLLGLGMDELAELGVSGGDLVMEKTDNTMPALATFVNILPAAVIMLGAMVVGPKPLKVRTQKAAEAMAAARVEGKVPELYTTEILAEFPNLNPHELARKLEVQNQLGDLQNIIPNLRTDLQNKTLLELRQELDTISAKEFKVQEQETLTSMTPDEILSIATETQMSLMQGEAFLQIWKTKKAEPIWLERLGTQLILKRGLEDAYAAQLLGLETIPVRIKETKMDAGTIRSFADRIQIFQERARVNTAKLRDSMKRSTWDTFANLAWDRAYPMKARLALGGVTGRRVIREFENMAGSSTSAKLFIKEVQDTIFKKLDDSTLTAVEMPAKGVDGKPIRMTEEMIFDQIMHSRTLLEIFKRKPAYKADGGFTSTMHQALLEDLRNQLGPNRYDEIWVLSVKMFDRYRSLLDDIKAEGLITEKTYNDIRLFNYEPQKFIDLIDPKQASLYGSTASVRDSGVQFLKGGSFNPVEMSARQLLSEYALRTKSRILKNRANVRLAEFAEQFPNNGMVAKVREGRKIAHHLTPIEYFLDGKKHTMSITPSYANLWQAVTPDMTGTAATMLRVLSGTPLIKATSVGYNPAFFMMDFPRNIAHMLAASRRDFVTGEKLYSAAIPEYIAQVTVDMANVAKSALRRDGFFIQLANEGAFPQFLAHVGRNESANPSSIHSVLSSIDASKGNKVMRGVKQAINSLSWINEYSEILMRMAVAQRTLAARAELNIKARNGFNMDFISGKERAIEIELLKQDPEIMRSAAHNARRVIDYAQSGQAGKVLDTMIPFLNPSIQATRTGLRGMKEEPYGGAMIFAQLGAAVGMTYMYNWIENENTVRSITDDDMVTGFNFVLPEHFNIRLEDGSMRYPYIHIPTENLFMTMVGAVNFTMRRRMEGRDPSSLGLALMEHATMITPQNLIPPSIDAGYKLWGNKDFWRDRDVWQGVEVKSYEEFYGKHRADATPSFYIEMGRAIDELGFGELKVASPERLKAVVNTFIADHPISSARTLAMRTIFATEDVEAYQRVNAELFDTAPFLKKWLKLGNPDTNLFADSAVIQLTTPTIQKHLNDLADQKLTSYRRGEIDIAGLRSFLRTVPPEEAERLARRIEVGAELIKILEMFPDRTGMPNPTWWKSIGENLAPKDRAQASYEVWARLDQPRRNKFERMIRLMPSFMGTQGTFWREFNRMKDLSGTDQAGTDIYSSFNDPEFDN